MEVKLVAFFKLAQKKSPMYSPGEEKNKEEKGEQH